MYTPCNDARAEADIGEDVAAIVTELQSRGLHYDAIYLVGSFGRGEGSARFDGVRWRALNDFDVLVISSAPEVPSGILKAVGADLAQRLRVDFVDIGWLARGTLSRLCPTIENYDLKNASLLLAGTDIRGEVPEFEAHQITGYEFARLICNRTAGILSAQTPLRSESEQYQINQYVKACIAVGDAAGYLGDRYYSRYRERYELFRSLAESRQLPFALSDTAVGAVCSAYETKLGPSGRGEFRTNDALLREMIQAAFLAVAARCLGECMQSVDSAGKALAKNFSDGRTFIESIDDFLCVWLHRDKSRSSAIRNRILFSLPAIYSAEYSTTLRRWLSYASRFWVVPGALKRRGDLASIVSLWEEYCH